MMLKMNRCNITIFFLLSVLLSSGCGQKKISSPEFVVERVSSPPTSTGNDHYVSNMDPLLPKPLIKLPVGEVKPEGWLEHQLVLMKEGMVGRLPELSPYCIVENNAWANPEGIGQTGWEELPYWLRGFIDMGYLLEDEETIERAHNWIEICLSSQDEDGYFGPRKNKLDRDLWPNMVMLDALISYYDRTGDDRVMKFMTKYFKWEMGLPDEELLPRSWQKIRGGDNLHSVIWLYNHTGEKWLLELAHRIHERTANWTGGIASWHGVNICQCFREPAQYYQLSKDVRHLEATHNNYETAWGIYGQVPGGMFGADENARPGFTGPRQAAETCSMIEFMRSCEILLSITGDPVHADRCEDVAFNSFPASVQPDFKGLHYLTSPNMVSLDMGNKSPGIQNIGAMLPYSPSRMYRCCQHNVSQGWPYFIEHLWMATPDNGLAAVLYGPSSVEAKVGRNTVAKISEETNYPFEEDIRLTLELSQSEAFPLYLRIPGWCRSAAVSVNGENVAQAVEGGGYLKIVRQWNTGDEVLIHLPMKMKLTRWEENMNSVSLNHGPLTYSLKIEEKWETVQKEGDWAIWEVLPATDWNYGLILPATEDGNLEEHFQFIASDSKPDQPFAINAAPVQIKARGRKIPAWTKESDGLVGRLQRSPIFTEQPEEELSLIPMGCARLRISAFPVVTDDTGANKWRQLPPQIAACHVEGYLGAVKDGDYPKSLRERPYPFVWNDTEESVHWLSYGFVEPKVIEKSSVYWLDDFGQGRYVVPQNWKILYRDDTGEWKQVTNPSAYPTQAGQFNTVSFDPVTTDEIKLEAVAKPDAVAGIIEWQVE